MLKSSIFLYFLADTTSNFHGHVTISTQSPPPTVPPITAQPLSDEAMSVDLSSHPTRDLSSSVDLSLDLIDENTIPADTAAEYTSMSCQVTEQEHDSSSLLQEDYYVRCQSS